MTDAQKPAWRRIAGEPFFQFLILGLLLFAGHALWQRNFDATERTIVVDPKEIERRAVLFAGENKRTPTEAELQALIYDFVQEEALVREALRHDLGEGDTIVRRRLAQKARFMLEDNVDIDAPDQETLCAWLDENPEKFAQPPQRSFAHIFISPENLSDAALANKARTLKENATNANWEGLGDPFLLNRSYRSASYPDVVKAFGLPFAKSLFAMDVKAAGFQGPVESAFGLHLVRIDSAEELVMPECDAIGPALESEWRAVQRDRANAETVRAIVEQYEIVVDE